MIASENTQTKQKNNAMTPLNWFPGICVMALTSGIIDSTDSTVKVFFMFVLCVILFFMDSYTFIICFVIQIVYKQKNIIFISRNYR